jgi:hypothetical protein
MRVLRPRVRVEGAWAVRTSRRAQTIAVGVGWGTPQGLKAHGSSQEASAPIVLPLQVHANPEGVEGSWVQTATPCKKTGTAGAAAGQCCSSFSDVHKVSKRWGQVFGWRVHWLSGMSEAFKHRGPAGVVPGRGAWPKRTRPPRTRLRGSYSLRSRSTRDQLRWSRRMPHRPPAHTGRTRSRRW